MGMIFEDEEASVSLETHPLSQHRTPQPFWPLDIPRDKANCYQLEVPPIEGQAELC